jgi:hypothetical protein
MHSEADLGIKKKSTGKLMWQTGISFSLFFSHWL